MVGCSGRLSSNPSRGCERESLSDSAGTLSPLDCLGTRGPDDDDADADAAANDSTLSADY